MRNLIIIALSGSIILSLSCCGRIKCGDPVVVAVFQPDSVSTFIYNVHQYPVGKGFSGNHYSRTDTARNDSNGQVKKVELSENYDWVIEIPETGKRYEISNIHHEGKQRYDDGTRVSEMRHYCNRTTYFTLNGTEHKVDGGVYYYSASPKEIPNIYITK